MSKQEGLITIPEGFEAALREIDELLAEQPWQQELRRRVEEKFSIFLLG
jgi:hypothetical protein